MPLQSGGSLNTPISRREIDAEVLGEHDAPLQPGRRKHRPEAEPVKPAVKEKPHSTHDHRPIVFDGVKTEPFRDVYLNQPRLPKAELGIDLFTASILLEAHLKVLRGGDDVKAVDLHQSRADKFQQKGHIHPFSVLDLVLELGHGFCDPASLISFVIHELEWKTRIKRRSRESKSSVGILVNFEPRAIGSWPSASVGGGCLFHGRAGSLLLYM